VDNLESEPNCLILEPEPASKPKPIPVCGNCKHFQPYRDPATNHIHPTKKGRCGWRPDIKWPMAFRRAGLGRQEEDPRIYPVSVWKDTDAKTCACFSPINAT